LKFCSSSQLSSAGLEGVLLLVLKMLSVLREKLERDALCLEDFSLLYGSATLEPILNFFLHCFLMACYVANETQNFELPFSWITLIQEGFQFNLIRSGTVLVYLQPPKRLLF